MKMALFGKNKFGIVDAAVPQPDASSPLFSHWQRCNSVVLSWILTSLSPEIYRAFTYSDLAREVWEHLQDKFRRIGSKEITGVKRELALASQHGETVDQFVFRLERLWNRLDSYVATCHPDLVALPSFRRYQETGKIDEFLGGLDAPYKTARSQIQNTRPLPSLSEAISMIRDEESSLLLSGDAHWRDSLAFAL